MANINYYQILGVTKDVSQMGVKNAFRKLARELHPDLNFQDEQIEQRFRQVLEAYEILSDPSQRAKYDGVTDKSNIVVKYFRRSARSTVRAYWRAYYGVGDK